MEQLEISAESFRSKMTIPPELKKSYDAGVKNGLLMMFSKQTREETLKFMEGGNDVPQSMADGIFSVVVFLHDQSNGTMPPQIIIPVGVELLAHAVDVAKKAGIEVTDADVAEGMGRFIEAVLTASGVGPEQMQKMVAGMDSGQNPQGV